MLIIFLRDVLNALLLGPGTSTSLYSLSSGNTILFSRQFGSLTSAFRPLASLFRLSKLKNPFGDRRKPRF